MIEAISHITFIVKDLERTARFLREVFRAEEIYDSAPRHFSVAREKFFIVGGAWIAVMEGVPPPERTYDHVAFKVPDAEFEEYVSRVERLGMEIKTSYKRCTRRSAASGDVCSGRGLSRGQNRYYI